MGSAGDDINTNQLCAALARGGALDPADDNEEDKCDAKNGNISKDDLRGVSRGRSVKREEMMYASVGDVQDEWVIKEGLAGEDTDRKPVAQATFGFSSGESDKKPIAPKLERCDSIPAMKLAARKMQSPWSKPGSKRRVPVRQNAPPTLLRRLLQGLRDDRAAENGLW